MAVWIAFYSNNSPKIEKIDPINSKCFPAGTVEPGNVTSSLSKDERSRIEAELENNQTFTNITEDDSEFWFIFSRTTGNSVLISLFTFPAGTSTVFFNRVLFPCLLGFFFFFFFITSVAKTAELKKATQCNGIGQVKT